HRTDLPERAAAASVLQRRSRFEPVSADRRKLEIERQLRTVHEDAGAPADLRQRKTPLRRSETRLERPDLKQADGCLGIARHHREAGVIARRSLPRSEEHTSELQSPYDLVCRLLLEKKNKHECN